MRYEACDYARKTKRSIISGNQYLARGAANRYKFDSMRKNESPGPATKNDFALEGCHLINYAEGNETTIYC